MNFEAAVKYLESYVSYSDQFKVGYNEKNFNLPRIKRFLHDYGVDYSKIKFVHVGGSKGKGSTCLMIANYLKEKSFRVGLFTSPHVVKTNEDFWLNGKYISESKFVKYVSVLKKYIDSVGGASLTCFELKVVLALKYFVDEKVDFAVFEVGLGGRLDATNIINSRVAVLTSVEKEHTEYLGNSISKILDEKLGIFKGKRGVKLLVGRQGPEVKKLIKLKLKGCAGVYYSDEMDVPRLNCYFQNMVQSENAKVAYIAVKLLLEKVDDAAFMTSLKRFKLLGRFQVKKIYGKTVVFDIAHTPGSMKNLIESLNNKFPNKDFVFLISIMQAKDVDALISIIKGVAKKIVFTFSHSKRSILAGELFRLYKGKFLHAEFNDNCYVAYEDLLKNLQVNEILVVTGTHFLMGKIFRRFGY
ncbi:MAG: Mur ligase family protein [Candidatus Gracilibacteria bacterium]|jgi:dihydrofolate synthase/folylpolyglutamate synthase